MCVNLRRESGRRTCDGIRAACVPIGACPAACPVALHLGTVAMCQTGTGTGASSVAGVTLQGIVSQPTRVHAVPGPYRSPQVPTSTTAPHWTASVAS